MKILLISPYYSPGVGGSARLLKDVVDHLFSSGHHVEVITYGLDPSKAYRSFDEAQPYRIYRVSSQRLPGGSSIAMTWHLLRLALPKQYDVILSGVAFPSAILSHFVCCIARIPFVVYSMAEDVTGVEGSTLKTRLLASALRSAQCNMVISHFTKDKVHDLGVPDSRIVLIPPGINTVDYEHVSEKKVEDMRRRLGLEGKSVILTVARLDPRKGHDMIIRSMKGLCQNISNIHYLIVGYGERRRLRDIAESEGVADKVTFVDYVADADLPALYHLCDVYAMVSRWDPVKKEVEGFGIVYLEAAASGKPCVAGSAGGSSYAVADSLTGFVVDPTSIGDIEKAMHLLLSNSALATSMGLAGRKRVREEFERIRLLERVEAVLTSSGQNALSTRNSQSKQDVIKQ